MRINRQTYYHTQELIIPAGVGGLTRQLIRLPREEFDLITGIGIIPTLNTSNEAFKIGFGSNSKEFINLVHHEFFAISKEVAPKDRLMPVLFSYELDNRIDCRIQLISQAVQSEIRFDLIVCVENSRNCSHYQTVTSSKNFAQNLPDNLIKPSI